MSRRLVVAACFVLAAGVAYAVYALRVQEIRVTGLRTLDPRTVVRASGLRGGERILWIRLSSVTRRVERIPEVAEATVERSLLQTVVIHVRERMALVRLDRRPDLVVDGDGMVFRNSTPSGLPSLEGWRGSAKPGSSVDRVSGFVLRAYESFPGALRTRVARIRVGPPLTLWLSSGTEIRFGALVDLAEKARIAVAVLQKESGQPLEYVDVRAPSVPVSRRRAPPTPAPTPAPAPRKPATPATPAATPAQPATSPKPQASAPSR